MDFSTRVKAIVKRIPAGEVKTYKEVARLAGNPRAARAVANIMANNYDTEIPCHRVVRSDGASGGYNRGGPQVKMKLLHSEGVILLR